MTSLLDGNVLIALLVAGHTHHEAAESWFAGHDAAFATCAITEGSLARFLIRCGESAWTAATFVSAISIDSRHEFWPCRVPFSEVEMKGVIGHRQVTDAYLAQLARVNRGRLATFDQGLAKLHDDVVDLIPT